MAKQNVGAVWKPEYKPKKTSIGNSVHTKLNSSKRGKRRKAYRGQGR
jgi:hypothetical protein